MTRDGLWLSRYFCENRSAQLVMIRIKSDLNLLKQFKNLLSLNKNQQYRLLNYFIVTNKQKM